MHVLVVLVLLAVIVACCWAAIASGLDPWE
jgi:hypothetical protein